MGCKSLHKPIPVEESSRPRLLYYNCTFRLKTLNSIWRVHVCNTGLDGHRVTVHKGDVAAAALPSRGPSVPSLMDVVVRPASAIPRRSGRRAVTLCVQTISAEFLSAHRVRGATRAVRRTAAASPTFQ